MAENNELKPEDKAPKWDLFAFLRGRNARTRRLMSTDAEARRAVLYFLLFVLLFVGGFGPVGPDWGTGPRVHEALEILSTLLAFVVGALALVRFYSKKRGTFLFIGTGFLGTAVLDTFHVLVSSGIESDPALMELSSFAAKSSWSFTASGAYLSVFLFVSWLSWRQESKGEDGKEIREGPVYLTAFFLAALIFVVFNFNPYNPQAIYPDLFARQPAEFFPAFFFVLTLGGYLRKGHWASDVFEHWLVMALIIAAMTHGAFMPFSNTFYDADFAIAHLLKLLSYVCVLAGLLASVYITFRREEEAAEATREANAALAREIDVRRQAERILQESEERLQEFLDTAYDLVQSADPEGNLLYVNRAWKEVLGYSDKDLETLNFFEILHPSCRERCRRQFNSVLSGQPLPSVDVDFLAADGRLVRCSGSANARIQNNEAVATRSIFRNVTESHEARKELEAFQANLQALVENTGDAIWSVNREFLLLTFNTAFSMGLEARTGREPKVGDLPKETFPETDAAWYREMYQRSLKGAAFSEFRDEEIGGQLRSYELFFNPIREAMGITGVAVFSKDVTARRRTQVALRMAKEEAEEANQAKSQFLANMSHELRTPLNSVIGFTNILLKNKGGKFANQELGFLDRISANGKHLLELINEVLDLAKIEAGRMELDLQPIVLEEFVNETISQMEGQVKDKKLVLRAEIPDGLPEVQIDAGKLKQVIINLVGNSLKFTEEGEVVVEISKVPEGEGVAGIRVMDTGIGIPADRLQGIFEAFQQADGTTSRKFGGTGLGLTISRSLCQLMGYDLKVESEVGKGTTFTILMAEREAPEKPTGETLIEEALKPFKATKPRDGSPPAEPVKPPEGMRQLDVLVIDDDSDSRVLITHFLEDLGCTVETAASADEGLTMAKENHPELITLDLMMPGVTGWEALKEFKADPDLSGIPVVIVSTLAGESERSHLLGAVDLITKPVDGADLLQAINRNVEDRDGKTILVVDDHEDTRAVVGHFLEEAGMEVVLAANGEEAEARLDEALPDAILLDLVMPVMDGVTFLTRLRENGDRKDLPVIICTGKELSREDQVRLQGQAAGILPKGERLEEALRGFLTRFFPDKGTDGDA